MTQVHLSTPDYLAVAAHFFIVLSIGFCSRNMGYRFGFVAITFCWATIPGSWRAVWRLPGAGGARE